MTQGLVSLALAIHCWGSCGCWPRWNVILLDSILVILLLAWWQGLLVLLQLTSIPLASYCSRTGLGIPLHRTFGRQWLRARFLRHPCSGLQRMSKLVWCFFMRINSPCSLCTVTFSLEQHPSQTCTGKDSPKRWSGQWNESGQGHCDLVRPRWHFFRLASSPAF